MFISVDSASVDGSGSAPESPASALLEDLDSYRFVLTDGKFVAAMGFDILENGAAANLHEIPEETVKAGGVAKLSLTWRPASR